MKKKVDPNHSFSWRIASDTCITKDCDITVKKYFGSTLAQIVYPFFEVTEFKEGDKRSISVTYEGARYSCEITSTRPKTANYIAIRLWLRPIKPRATYLKNV
ncbi:MAG: hypothetical protein PHV81_06215, partial [Candidatus Methanomethylophilaceae archaeon]|nr:hypothetical protein [Candidatus Methanomethylophilaceae archaeon]